MMRAAVFTGPGDIRIQAVPLPAPAPGEVRVRLEGCGLCASNLPVWEGRPWFDYPLPPGRPGHEGWGIIDALGDGVSGLQKGDRVAFISNGAYAEMDTARAKDVVVLPDALKKMPFPGEPLGCAMNIFARSDIRRGQWVAVVGVGFLGAILVSLAVTSGANVIAVSRRGFALDIARNYGALAAIPAGDIRETVRAVREITGGALCDRVIEATGYQAPLDLAGELTRERGRLVIAGYHQDSPRQVDLQLWNWRGLDVINAHERDPAIYVHGIREAAATVAGDRLNPFPLFTHSFPLEEIGQAFEALQTREPGFLKALITL